MQLITLGSGSSGNGYILQNSEETIIIECGINFKHAVEALDGNISKVVGCLITHSHGDHAGYIKQYAKAFNIFATKGTLEERKVGDNDFHYHVIPMLKEFRLGNFVIKAFSTEHDTKEPCGFIIYHEDIGTLLFITDTHHIRYRFNFNIEHILIECNHTDELVDESVNNGIIPLNVEIRAKATHMSLKRCVACLKTMDLSHVRNVMLIHISENNGNAEMFRKAVIKATGKPVYIARKGFTLELI